MRRVCGAVVAMICLFPAWLRAQEIQVTINASSASVYQAPSLGSVVIGHAARGTVLDVTRELGSWLKVSWPEAQDGIGYVHASAGRVAYNFSSAPTAASSQLNASSAAAPGLDSQDQNMPPLAPAYVTPSTHLVGVGVRMGNAILGGTARAWSGDRLGLEINLTRYTSTGVAPGRLVSMEAGPSLLYSFGSHVTDYLWVRPYVGSGAYWRRQSFTPPTAPGLPFVHSGYGLQGFGGAEVTFAGAPRIAVSVDLGYRWSRAQFDGHEPGQMALTISGHWYVR
jgi:SH3 domain-containing protein